MDETEAEMERWKSPPAIRRVAAMQVGLGDVRRRLLETRCARSRGLGTARRGVV